MWFIQRTLKGLRPDLSSEIDELVLENTRNIFLSSGVLFFLLMFFSANMVWQRPVIFWSIFPTAFLVIGLAMWLEGRHVRLAQIIWMAGMGVVILLASWLFGVNEGFMALSLLPLIGVVMIGWQGGLIVEILLIILFFLLWRPPLQDLPVTSRQWIVGVGFVCFILGWVIERTFNTVSAWAMNGYNEARQNLEEVRQHRAQLAVTKKQLDLANYRLERANVALVVAWRAAEEARRAKAQFVTTVSHELRTPLNLITGFSEVMLTAPENYNGIPLPGPYRSDMSSLYQSSLHLLELVDDVIDMERIDAQKIIISYEHSEIGIIITEATNMVADLIHAKGLELRVKIAPHLPVVWVDRLRIRQIILNLLVNAVRFTSQGWVEITANLDGNMIKVCVSDNGQGISPDKLETVFKEFNSDSQPSTKWHSGSGLGLPISKRLVELHKGEMGVTSVVGKGTTFWFTLPLNNPEAAVKAELSLSSHYGPVDNVKASQRILVLAHHDLSLLNFIQRYLSDYKIVGTETLDEGLKLATESRSLALITSYDVPKDQPTDLLIIQIPLTDRHKIAEGMGANDLLVKPISREQLIQAVQQVHQPLNRILIADDDPDFVSLIRRMLASTFPDAVFDEAYHGEEALNLVREHAPDLVMMDLKMPILDGREVISQIRKEFREDSPYIILISGELGNQIMDQLYGDLAVSRGSGYPMAELLRATDDLIRLLSPGWFKPEN